MYVLHAWKSSLQIFIPSNFKLFLLVTLKTIISTFKKYLKYGWPFILSYAFFTGLLLTLDQSAINAASQEGAWFWPVIVMVSGSIALVSYIFCNFLVAIFARPSVDQKNCAYMRAFTKQYFLGYLLLSFIFFIVSIFFYIDWALILPDLLPSKTTSTPMGVAQHFLVIVWYITNIFGTLFYLDLGGSFTSIFKALWFAIKMTFYNLPFVALVALVLLLGARIGDDFIPILSNLHLILYPFLFCFLTTLYTKKVHDQARLYQGT